MIRLAVAQLGGIDDESWRLPVGRGSLTEFSDADPAGRHQLVRGSAGGLPDQTGRREARPMAAGVAPRAPRLAGPGTGCAPGIRASSPVPAVRPAQVSGPHPEVIGPQTELVIDGYTRSASTFAVYAFQLCQDEPVRLAHHLHAPAQLIAAARRGIPALLLIREPQGAILSQLIQEPEVALRDALVAYFRFHDPDALPAVFVAEFEQVTHDFRSVIRRLNTRFGTNFTEFAHTDATMHECFEL